MQVAEISQFDGSASFDPDGSITNYEWDFGDGTTGTGPVLGHSYAQPGVYTVVLVVSDDGGLVGVDALIVTVQ